jgi:flavin reductase (DIM6/NTAB) family NADH-FMN oxidoreductase RutF
MTIGWATIGYVWHKPVLMVAVRNTRHTFGLMEGAPDFTVSVPSADMKDAIKFCGTRSGREVDKFSACNLTTVPAQKTHTPIVDFAGYHFECQRVYKSAMDERQLDSSLKKLYPDNDYHTLYFGEILSCYEVTK